MDNTPWPEERIARLREMAANGATYEQAAHEFGTSLPTVRRHAYKHGIKFRRMPTWTFAKNRMRAVGASLVDCTTDLDRLRVAVLRAGGFSEFARQHNCSVTLVHSTYHGQRSLGPRLLAAIERAGA